MKRNMDLIRKILIELEKRPFSLRADQLEIEGFSEDEIAYHVLILYEAGLIDALDLSSHGGPDWRPRRLTWDGHEFLDASRDDDRWEKAKNVMTEKAGGFSFEILKQLLVQLMKDAVFGT